MIALSRLAPIAATALAECADAPVLPSRGRWDLVQHGAPIAAHLDGEWLVLTSPVAAAVAPRDLLAWNAALPGLVKFALSAEGAVQIRAEIPVDEDSGALIRATRGGFDAALAMLGGERLIPVLADVQPDLARLCEEAGWKATPRGDAACVVELECPGAFHQATVAAHGAGVRAFVSLPKCDESVAIHLLLLTAGGAVRMARPTIESSEGRVNAAFEVSFPTVPAAAHLAHALAALSVACRLCAEELRALQDPDVAREFLALSETQTRKETTP